MSAKMKERVPFFVLVMAAALGAGAGCGGGTSGSSSGSAKLQTSHAGDAVLTYFGQPKPLLTTSSGPVSVVAQAGATYSSVTLEPPANLDSTYLVISRLVGNESGLYKIPYPSGNVQLLYQASQYSETPGISAYGTIAFTNDGLPLNSIRDDGTGLATINFTGVSEALWPHYSTDGTNRLTFTDGSGGLYVGPGTGGTATKIQTNDFTYAIQGEAWNPAGTQILYSVQDATIGYSDLYMTPSTGGITKNVTPGLLQNTGMFANPSWSADGQSIVAMYVPGGGGGTCELIRFDINDPNTYTNITPTGDFEQQPCFSPDGTKIAFYRDNTNSQTAGVYVEDSLGLNAQLLVADPSNNLNDGYLGLAWSPFLPKETVVSASASTFYHQAASGFLLSQNGDQFGSFVAFTATTPSSATITAPSSNSQYAPMIFTISADSITSIGYINNYYNSGTTVTLSSTPQVVVSVDSITGQVDVVAPALAAKPLMTKNADGTVSYTGRFKAVYDGAGTNLAPTGAHQLVVNPKTGKLVSFL